jgi:hypothetical protein
MADWEQVFQQHMPEFLAQLVAQGFEPPLYCAFIDGNGSLVYGRYDTSVERGLTFTLVTSHIVAQDFALPINAMFVDQGGEAAYVALEMRNELPITLN